MKSLLCDTELNIMTKPQERLKKMMAHIKWKRNVTTPMVECRKSVQKAADPV